MFCFSCEKKLIVGKRMKIGEYGLLEVDICSRCPKCDRMFEKTKLLQNDLEQIKIEMKGHLKEYRDLAKKRDKIKAEILNDEFKIFSIKSMNSSQNK